jgi:hypothetical protein
MVVALAFVHVQLVHAGGAADCNANGQPGVKVSIGIGGSNCIPIGSSTDVSSNPIWRLLITFVQFLSVGIGFAVTGGIIWGGIVYMTARANPNQVQKGIEIIRNAILGLILFIFMYAVLEFVIPGTIFG